MHYIRCGYNAPSPFSCRATFRCRKTVLRVRCSRCFMAAHLARRCRRPSQASWDLRGRANEPRRPWRTRHHRRQHEPLHDDRRAVSLRLNRHRGPRSCASRRSPAPACSTTARAERPSPWALAIPYAGRAGSVSATPVRGGVAVAPRRGSPCGGVCRVRHVRWLASDDGTPERGVVWTPA